MSDEDLDLVRLAAAYYRFEANRLADARERFGLAPNAFYIRVNALLADPAVVVALPVEVGRLRRARDARMGQKTA